MTARELFSLQEDNNKLKSLYMELAQHEDFNPFKSNTVSDVPKGGGAKDFVEWYTEEKERIESEIERYKKKLQEDRKRIDDYICAAPYPEGDIIRYRAINNLSWEEIGILTGYDRRHVARKFWSYINENAQNAQDAHATL